MMDDEIGAMQAKSTCHIVFEETLGALKKGSKKCCPLGSARYSISYISYLMTYPPALGRG